MAATELMKMKTLADLYADILSQILSVDVEIMDNEMVRVAATGKLKNKTGRDMTPEAGVYQTTMKTGEVLVIETPGEHELCRNCPKKLSCKEKFEMSIPIVTRGDVIGVIGFVCHTQQQKNHILKNFRAFEQFLTQISQLIALKIIDTAETDSRKSLIEMLETVLERVEAGILVTDRSDTLTYLNGTAARLLGLKGDAVDTAVLRDTGETFGGLSQFSLSVKNAQSVIRGMSYSVNIDRFSTILIFNENDNPDMTARTNRQRRRTGLKRIIGKSAGMAKLSADIETASLSASHILIQGEKGTEKQTAALAIHELSSRSHHPFVSFHCASEPPGTLAAALFGKTDESGAAKPGKLEIASRGTLFLNEVEALPLNIQIKLLQALQAKAVIRVGESRPVKITTRVIAAASADIARMVEEGLFREDLYYQLSVLPVRVPPLRERSAADIQAMAKYCLNQSARALGRNITEISGEFLAHVSRYGWPGNVWEMQNAMEYSVNMMPFTGTLGAGQLPPKITSAYEEAEKTGGESEADIPTIADMERQMIMQALSVCGNNTEGKQKVAQMLGIGIATLYRKLKEYKL